MKLNKEHILFDDQGHLTEVACHLYASSNLLLAKRHEIEMHCLGCEMCNDIIEGAEALGTNYEGEVSSAQKKIQATRTNWWKQYRIAAVLALLISSGFILVYVSSQFKKAEPTIAELVPKETLATEDLIIDTAVVEPELVQTPALQSLPSLSSETDETLEISDEQLETETTLAETIVEEFSEDAAIAESSALAIQEEELINTALRGQQAPAEISAAVPEPALEQLEEKLQETRIVTGRVLSEADDPLSGVNVILPGTIHKTITNASGYYELTVPDSTTSLTYSFPEVEIAAATQNTNKRKAAPSQEMLQFAEVVISREAQKTEQLEVIKVPQPINGRRDLDDYLKTNIIYPADARANDIKGKVVLEFLVNENGSLSDFTIVKGLGFGCDEEAIRVLREGPPWSPGTINNEPKAERVRVRIKFDPIQ